MIKVSAFRGETEAGPVVIPLFGAADGLFEKVAAPSLLSPVSKYIEGLRPRQDAQYVLVNALGAGEWWGANINGDFFPESALIHAPDDWTGNPLLDKIKSQGWAYGFPTFYFAHPYAHHRNKDASRAFGEVELSLWNPHMKRVELVVRVDKDKCAKFGGTGVWDKLKAGEFPDVSMGTKVPYDTCSICLDWKRYNDALATFDPKKHKHPGEAVLVIHKRKPIRGLSITRKDYCDHALKMMNKIFPDGRKVFVYNDFPRFFDISFVFIGADKTAKVMLKIASGGQSYWFLNGAELAEKLGYSEEGVEKTASALSESVLGKSAAKKEGEITKDVLPSQFAGRAVPLLTASEPSIPKDLLNVMGGLPIGESLSTATGLGIILRPQEFQRIILIGMGRSGVADELDQKGIVFGRSEEEEKLPMRPDLFSPVLARLLLPLLLQRSMLGPIIEKRVLVLPPNSSNERKRHSSLSSELLHKMGSAYNNYRRNVMNMVANAQELLPSIANNDSSLLKIASAPVEVVFTPLSAAYIQSAFMDEVGVLEGSKEAKASGQRGEGSPLKDRVLNQQSF